MSDQHIGVSAQFETRQFSRGLATYLRGLAQATAATNQTVAAINNLGAATSSTFAAMSSNARMTANALRAVANAARTAQRALNPRSRARTVQPAGAQTTPLNAQLLAATGRAQQQTTQQIRAATQATQQLGAQARTTTISISGLNAQTIALGTALGNVAAQGIIGAARALSGFGREVIEIVTFFERLELSVAFFTARSFQAEDATITFNEALAQGAQEAQGLLIWLQRLAVASPFTTRTVGTIFRTAQAYGLTRKEAEQLTPLLLDFGAAAGLNEDILERLALALGQVRSRGKLTGEEVRQLGNSGLPVRDILVKALGIANSEFDELLESGALTTDVVIPHLIAALRDFEGAGERVAFGTIGGIISAMDELREISTAKFFFGFLEPLKEDFQELFKVLNQPEVLAFITILGQELGEKFKNAVLGTVAAIRNLVLSFQALDAGTKQQIIVFAAATAGVFALVAAFGLLTLAMNLIANPLVLIATTIGFLVSEWTSGFTVLRNIAGRTSSAIIGSLLSILRATDALLLGFSNFIVDMTSGLTDLGTEAANWGFNIGASLAEGINASGTVLASAMRGIGQLLAFWLAPGSAPRVAPVDVWGKAGGQEYLDAYAEANPETAMNKLGEVVERGLTDATIKATKKSLEVLQSAQADATLDTARILNKATRGAYGVVVKSTREVLGGDAVQDAATEAGIQVSESFVDGFLSRIPAMTPKISEELQKVLSAIGGGRQLTRQGALAFGGFLNGFIEADFGVLDTLSSTVQNFLQNLVDTGDIEEVDLPRLLFGARESLAQGIEDIERLGHVSEQTMQSIRVTAGGASRFVLDLLKSYVPLRDATEDAEEAQNNLNAITEKYKNIITPLRKELELINEANRIASDEEKILSLRRLIANEGVSDRRRRNAQLEIDQIIAEQRVRGLEDERDAATETAEEELDSREKTRDELEKQFAVLQRNIEAQQQQLQLFGQEASIIRRLEEEAAKLREKQMTQEELHLKFLEFQNEELDDAVAAAKAKYDLDRADATVLEKEQAAITLAEIALRRRNREAEAIKLGIPVEELTKLRDIEVSLDDIGVKVKEAFTPPEGETLGQSLVDANAITAEWETTLENVRDRWNEIKESIRLTAEQINTNLPDFLKIFPEEPGGEPPIIGFIRNYTGVLVGLAVASTTYKIATRIASLVTAIRSLMTIGAIGTAAGAGGAAAGAAGGSAAVAAITTAVVTLGLAALTTTGYVLGLKAALDAFGRGEEAQAKVNVEQIDTTLGDFGPKLNQQISDLVEDVTPNPEAQTVLAQTITDAAVFAIQDGFGDEHVVASIGNAINRAIVEGVIADTPENRQAIADFRSGISSLLETTDVGAAPKINIITGAEITAEPTEDQKKAVKEDINTNFLAGITDKEQQSTFAAAMQSLITDAFAQGLTDAQIDALVFNAFQAGVKEGLVADTPENRTALNGFIDGIMLQLKRKAKIKSPSELSRDEIGMPLGEGVINGINEALTLFGPKAVTKTDDLFVDLKEKMAARMGEIQSDQSISWTAIATANTTEVETMANTIDTEFFDLDTGLTTHMTAIKTTVVGGFTAIRTSTEAQIKLLRTNVVRLFAGEEGSILDAIETVFLGEEDIVPRKIGVAFMEGIGQGMIESKQDLADSMTTALAFALGAAQTDLEISSPSAVAAREIGRPLAQGIAEGVLGGLGSITRALSTLTSPFAAGSNQSSVMQSQVVNNSHYHLNVRSAMQSQGIVRDFGIMRTLEAG